MTDRFYRKMRYAIECDLPKGELLEILKAEKESSDKHKDKMKKLIGVYTNFKEKFYLNFVTITGEITLGHATKIDRNVTMFDPEFIDKSKDLIKAYFFDYLFNPEHGNG